MVDPTEEEDRAGRSDGSPSDGLVIAWCGPEAADVVHRLSQAAFAPQAALDPPSSVGRETVEVVAADLAAGRGVLATLDGVPVAAVRVLVADDGLHLRRVAVHPDYQRRGIARAVMGWLHAEAPSLGCREVRLGVRHALPANMAFYRSLGYRVATEHDYWSELRLVLVADPPAG